MNSKIVVFSWTGNTAACAVALQQALHAELFLLVEKNERAGNKGFALGGFQATIGAGTKLKELPDISNADVLILGMPVWASTVPPAMNTFMRHCNCGGKSVYVFTTQMSGTAPQKLEKRLKTLIGRQGGRFVQLFDLCVPQGKQLSVEEALPHVTKWAERIQSGK